jgi:hypothetical protein
MKKLFLTVAATAWILTGCQSVSTSQRWSRSEVYFGLSKPDGSLISSLEWDDFVNDVITPKFPAGLSVVHVAGQWRNASGCIEKEQSKMLVLLHPSSAAAEAQIDEIRASYRRRFKQEAVLKVTMPVQVSFKTYD